MSIQKDEMSKSIEYPQNHAGSFKFKSNMNILIEKNFKEDQISNTPSSTQKKRLLLRVESRMLSDLVHITDSK